ncbi:hypothetical protein E4T49_06589 [Aureobasidium sp. EXF-10728]|nr:hypothetical protein E4T49_06589 [Aureobasidium sp. EXF-10728]
MIFAQGSLASVLLIATCCLPTLNAHVLERDLVANSLTQRSFEGFTLGYYDDLSDLNLPVSCQNALQRRIYCDSAVANYTDVPTWRGDVDTEKTSYESVCDDSCGASIRSYWDGIVKECDQSWDPDTLTIDAVGWLWEAWNETCYYDPETGRNCNEVINELIEADKANDTHDYTCSYCRVEHYKMMQRSPYSAYDDFYQDEFQDTNEKCGLDNPTEMPFRWIDGICDFETYKIQEGDTCGSIAIKFSVSSKDVRDSYASIYGGELWKPACDQLRPGLSVCIPQPCKIYELLPDDTCASVEAQQHFPGGDSLRTYNPWIRPDCSNLQLSRDSPVGVVCVSSRSDEEVTSNGESSSSSSSDATSTTSSRVSTTDISSSSTGPAPTTGSHVTSSRPTEITSMATSGPSGAQLTAPTAGNSASATPSTSRDDVSGASVAGPGRLQVVVVLAALVLSQMI